MKDTNHMLSCKIAVLMWGKLSSDRVVRKWLSVLAKCKSRPVVQDTVIHVNTLAKSLPDIGLGLFQQLKEGQCSCCGEQAKRGPRGDIIRG
jgi:hypothetical protein